MRKLFFGLAAAIMMLSNSAALAWEVEYTLAQEVHITSIAENLQVPADAVRYSFLAYRFGFSDDPRLDEDLAMFSQSLVALDATFEKLNGVLTLMKTEEAGGRPVSRNLMVTANAIAALALVPSTEMEVMLEAMYRGVLKVRAVCPDELRMLCVTIDESQEVFVNKVDERIKAVRTVTSETLKLQRPPTPA